MDQKKKRRSSLPNRKLIASPGIEADVRVAAVLAQRGAIDEAFEWLTKVRDGILRDRQAADPYHQTLMCVVASPFLQPLRKDLRWDALFTEFLDAPWIAADTAPVTR